MACGKKREYMEIHFVVDVKTKQAVYIDVSERRLEEARSLRGVSVGRARV
ncbi:MAG: hypothetical protein QW429_03365 [Thermoprotei archaeon]